MDLYLGFAITLISVLIGYSLGKHQTVVPPDTKKQIQQIFKRVVPNPEVGPVERPDVRANYFRDNPRAAEEHEEMNRQFEELNRNG